MKRVIKFSLIIILFFSINDVVNSQNDIFFLHHADLFLSSFDSDYSTGNSSDTYLYGIQLNSGFPLLKKVEIQLDMGLIKYPSNLTLYKFAVRPFYRNNNILLSISYGYGYLSGLTNHSISANFESYENDILSAVGSINYDFLNLGDNQYAVDLFLLIYPIDDLMISSGASLAPNDFKQTDIDLVMKIEWMLPINKHNHISLYGQYGGNYIQQTSFGVKFYFGFKESLKKHHRENGFYSARFK